MGLGGWGLAVALVMPLAGILFARCPWSLALGGLRGFLWFFALTFLVHFLYPSAGALPVAGSAPSGVEGLGRALAVVGRIIVILLSFHLVSLTTSPLRLVRGLSWFLSPLGRLSLPVDDAVLLLSVGLQFLPTLGREVEEVRQAQASRGIPHLDPRPWRRFRALPALVVPLFLRAIRRSEALTLAMLTRGYQPGRPLGGLAPLGVTAGDAAFLLSLALLLLLAAGADGLPLGGAP
jgi:energy-coupling factor transporter transmembrane protein EcfT